MARLLLLIGVGLAVGACSPVGGSSTQNAPATSVPTPSPQPQPNPQPVAQPVRLGALGDSITRAYNVQSFNVDAPLLSWSTGDSLSTSMANRIRLAQQALGKAANVVTGNGAVVGETVLGLGSTLLNQAAALAVSRPNVVTLEIGANDLCQGLLATSADQNQFRARIVQALQTLTLAAHPPAVISLASIPRVYSLTLIPQLAQNSFCGLAWSLVCPNLQVGPATFEAQWMAANQALSQAAAQVGGSVVYDGGAVANTTFTAADVSAVDCFHPSVAGQGKLSQAVWPTVQTKINQFLAAP